jgi:hypothetical protein
VPTTSTLTSPSQKAGAGASTTGAASATSADDKTAVNTNVLTLTQEQRTELQVKKVTCPFMGSIVSLGLLPVRNSMYAPLAKISDIGVPLGGLGGAVMKVLAFARNHGKMPSVDNPQILNRPVPEGYISLDLSGSVGSHYGHSGILAGDAKTPNSGRWSESEWQRFTTYAKGGHIARSAIGQFVGDNCRRDPQCAAGSTPGHVAKAIVWNLARMVKAALTGGDPIQGLTDLTRASVLSVAANEWALGTAFFQGSPRTITVTRGRWGPDEREPAYSMSDIEMMMREMRLPSDFKSWSFSAKTWLVNALHVNYHAAHQMKKPQPPANQQPPPDYKPTEPVPE